MGAPKTKLPPAEAPADTTRAMLAAMQFNETNRKMRASQGRKASFLTAGAPAQAGSAFQRPLNTALGS